jgi:hypothetical protein
MTSERETKLLAQRLTEGEVHDQRHNFDPKATAYETQQNLEDFYRRTGLLLTKSDSKHQNRDPRKSVTKKFRSSEKEE